MPLSYALGMFVAVDAGHCRFKREGAAVAFQAGFVAEHQACERPGALISGAHSAPPTNARTSCRSARVSCSGHTWPRPWHRGQGSQVSSYRGASYMPVMVSTWMLPFSQVTSGQGTCSVMLFSNQCDHCHERKASERKGGGEHERVADELHDRCHVRHTRPVPLQALQVSMTLAVSRNSPSNWMPLSQWPHG